MKRSERLDEWETIAIGLIAALVAHAYPLAAVALLLAAFLLADGAGALRPMRSEDAFGALAVTTAAALAGGPIWAIAGAYIALAATRLEAPAHAAGGPRLATVVHLAAGPLSLLMYRAGADITLVVVFACLAGVAYLDWGVRQLAEWRLGLASTDAVRSFFWAQVSVVAPLVIFPSVLTALVALGALIFARALSWRTAALHMPAQRAV